MTILIFEERYRGFLKKIDNNLFPIKKFLPLGELIEKQELILNENSHIVTLGGDKLIREVSVISLKSKFQMSIGIVYVSDSKLINIFSIPKNFEESLKVAFEKNIFQVDVLRCNNLYSIYSCEISESQIIKTRNRELQNGVLNKLSIIFRFLKSGFRLEPFDVKLKINGEREINSVVSSLTFIENDRDIFVSNLLKDHLALNDGKVSLLLISPLSVIEYLTFAIQSLQKSGKKLLPQAVSFIKSSKIEVNSRVPRKIVIDESVETTTPAIFEVERGALNLSLSKEFIESQKKFQGNEAKDSFQIENLPTEKERERLLTKKVSFFSTASEERHQKLFSQIRSDSKTSIEFINLMVLSSTLVTLGLFLGSASVIIGAMILAPLMAPIISLSMGFLRDNRELRVDASKTLTIGFLIALTLSFFLTLIIPLHSETSEILGRTQPNLLDFFVAFISGIAGAYAKGDENVAQNIAGVAIAVALVPPIAVAGIGIGWGESWIFFGAMLLFVANLFGIIFASSLTFILMGFSPIKVSKKGLILFSLLISMVIYPLYRSFEEDLELNSLREQFTTLDDNEKSFQIEVLDIKKIDRVYRVKLEIILQRDSNIEKTRVKNRIKTILDNREIEVNINFIEKISF